jgi:hypothetical protein
MNTKTTLTLTAALLATTAARAQQNLQQLEPQTTAVARQADPCAAPSATEVRTRQKIWVKFGRIIDQHAEQIGKGTHGTVDTGDVKGAAVDAASAASKPCMEKRAGNTNPAATLPPGPAKTAPATESKILLACPPDSSKVEGYPMYCLRPDNTLVSAIPIRAQANGAGALNANPVPNQSATPPTDTKPNPNAVTTTPTH